MKPFLLLILALSLLPSCLVVKDYELSECQKIPLDALNIAVADYSKMLRKYPQRHAVEVRISYTSTDWFYIVMDPWDKDYLNKYSLDWLQENIGSIPSSWCPTQYVEIDNVLYVWHNPELILSEDVVNALIRYNLVYYPHEEIIVSNGGDLTCYVFCKSNHRKYYRRIKPDYYGFIPLPKCNCH